MAQISEPVSDHFIGSPPNQWSEDDDTITTIFDQIDEAVADNADFIKSSNLLPAIGQNVIFKLGAVDDPESSSSHTLSFRYAKLDVTGTPISGGESIGVLVVLWQGDPFDTGVSIASKENDNVENGWTADSFTLSAAEANAITDYSDLYVEIAAFHM
jgi:hypothetical protein